MVVQHDDVEAEVAGDGEGLVADGPAIHGDQQRGALAGEHADGVGVGAVALEDAVGDVQQRFGRPGGAPIVDQQRRRAGAVDVIIPEDRDLLASLDGVRHAGERLVHGGQRRGVGHQLADRRIEVTRRLGHAHAAPGENAGEQIVDPMRLGQRQRGRLARRIEPRPPRSAEDGVFDAEEGGRRSGGVWHGTILAGSHTPP